MAEKKTPQNQKQPNEGRYSQAGNSKKSDTTSHRVITRPPNKTK